MRYLVAIIFAISALALAMMFIGAGGRLGVCAAVSSRAPTSREHEPACVHGRTRRPHRWLAAGLDHRRCSGAANTPAADSRALPLRSPDRYVAVPLLASGAMSRTWRAAPQRLLDERPRRDHRGQAAKPACASTAGSGCIFPTWPTATCRSCCARDRCASTPSASKANERLEAGAQVRVPKVVRTPQAAGRAK